MNAKLSPIFVLEVHVSTPLALSLVSVHLDKLEIQKPIAVKIKMSAKMNLYAQMEDV